MTTAHVASIGDNCIDRYERPLPQVHVGGNALNVAVNLARAGLVVVYAGAVGDDADGRTVLAALAAEGIDSEMVEVAPGLRTGFTRVELGPDGDRVFLEETVGASGAYLPGEATLAALGACDWVHGAGLHADASVLTRISGPRLSFDFSQRQTPELVAALAPALDIGFFSGARLGRTASVVLAREAVRAGARCAVVTLGKNGSVAFDGELIEQPAHPAAIVDTLGAGDALIAAVIAARLAGAGTADALDAGGRAAAEACGRYGAWPS